MNSLWDNIFKPKFISNKITDALKENYIFSDLNPAQLHFVQDMLHIRQYKAGEIIFRQSEIGYGMYIILKGHINIYVSGDSFDQTEANKEQLITSLHPKDFFGELSLVQKNNVRTATAVAVTDTEVLAFFASDLEELIDRKPNIALKLIRKLAEVLGRRLTETTEKISQFKKEVIEMTKDAQNTK